MQKINAAITGVGGYVPEHKLTNKMLEEMVDTSDEWIRSRTGIHERRIMKGGTVSDMAEHAVRQLLEKTNTKPEEVDLVLFATITGDHPFPASANIVSHRLGMTKAFSYDISAACSGFLYALETGSKFIETGKYQKVVVIGGDLMSSIIDYTDRNTCVIFGDGCGAVMLEPTEEPVGIIDNFSQVDGSGKEFLFTKAGGGAYPITHEAIDAREQFVFQDGKPVFKLAVTKMPEAAKIVMDRNNLTPDDIQWLVPHQANKRIIDVCAKACDVPEERVMLNIQKYGNTTAGTLPLCLWDYESQLKKGDNLILAAFGGGFTWGATYLKWAY